MSNPPNPKKTTLTDRMRVFMKGIVIPIVTFLNRIGVTPNMVTTIGLIGNFVAAALIGTGHITYGGLVALLAGACDGLDGSLARLQNEVTSWGAFVDSVTDRYSELALLFGLFNLLRKSWKPDDGDFGVSLCSGCCSGSVCEIPS